LKNRQTLVEPNDARKLNSGKGLEIMGWKSEIGKLGGVSLF
jgi:hypothetical protein